MIFRLTNRKIEGRGEGDDRGQLFHSDPWSSCLVFLLLLCDSHLDFWPSHGSGKR